MNSGRLFKPFLFTIVAAGVAVLIFSGARLSQQNLDWRFLMLLVAMATVASRLSIPIPHVKGEVTVGDTLIFLTLLLYGGEAAVFMAALDGLSSSLYVTKKPRVWLFNACQMAISTFVTVWALRLCFGPTLNHNGYSNRAVAVVCVMALVQYISNSGLVATYTALKTNQPLYRTWRNSYLWTSMSYFAGASVASIAVRMANDLSGYAVMMITPIIAIIYFTYKTYLRNVQTSMEKAEQAKQHVEELSQYIEEQERIREQFGQIEKMSALGELASGVAHDFNNTLAGILGRAELMLRKVEDPEIRRGLEIIVKSAQDGAGTVKRIQDFARQRRDHDFEPVAVDQLLIDVNEITRPRWKDRAQANNIHINLNLQIDTNALIMGDPSELREVLVNLVFNAVDAMPQGGRLKLAAREADGAVEIAVSDTGTGMTPEIRSRVFDPFFTTKGKAGMGLGLAVCYGIVQRHEGTVEIESELGQGTTFRIRLPITHVKPKPETKKEPVPHLTLVPKSGALGILVVDDEDAVRRLLVDILENQGYEVTPAENGEEALKFFDAKRFKAVFTDVGMPGMSGWELARAIRERDAEMPVAVITGWGDAVSSTEQETAKVDWVVTKPFSIDRITEITAELANRNNQGVAALPIAAMGT
ncbi:MAG TPA: ATP-binding protein [Pyrinomonadaceae bacterium]|jgi:signal transduction histidine kinase/ActR/RegA family two-component response regulator